MRAVLDTNVLVRALINPRGTVRPVLRRLGDGEFTVLYAQPLLQELVDVLRRPRIRQRYRLATSDTEDLLTLIALRGELVEPDRRIVVCRDPHDDVVLQVAVAGSADVIVSCDEDLLALAPFAGIAIVPPAIFLAMLDAEQRGHRLVNERPPVWATARAAPAPPLPPDC